MKRGRRFATGVAAALVFTSGVVAVASVTGIPPGSRVRIEMFGPRDHGGTPAGPASDGLIVSKLEQRDPAHWGGSFVRGDTLIVTFVDVDIKTAQTALAKAGVSSSVQLESRSISLADADVVRGRIQGTGLMGTRLVGLGYDASRGVVTADAQWPDVSLVRKLDKATAGTHVPVRIHWTFATPRAA
jgi:hypothetical protein